MQDIEYLTVKEVARILRKRPATVREYIKAGRLKAKKVGRDYRIAKRDLQAFLAA